MFKYLKNLFLFFSLLSCFCLIGLHAEATKQEMWDNMSEEVGHWVDRLGYPIDKEVKDIVIALNLLGIETIASCEGHLDHRNAYPWVSIQVQPPEVKKLMEELADLQEQIKNEVTVLKTKFPIPHFNEEPEVKNLKKIEEKRESILKIITHIQIKCLEPLNQLLNQFYEIHETSYDNTLIVLYNFHADLLNVGGVRQEIRTEEEKRFHLAKYQEEMKAFAEFLKQKFMNEKSD